MPNEAVIHEYVRAFNQGDIDALQRLFAADALIHGALGWGGFDQVASIWRMLHESFQMTLTVERILESGDEVVVRFSESGHFVKPFRGQPPTRQKSSVVAIEWFEMRGGLIQRRWGVRDSASHFKQLGVT